MATAAEIATRYFEALGRQDLEAAVVWAGDADPVTDDAAMQLHAALD